MSSSRIPVTGTFAATGQSASLSAHGSFNMLLAFAGAVATIVLERSFDGGVTWNPVSADNTGSDAAYADDVNAAVTEPGFGVLYRWNCTAYTSGTITYRLG